MRGIDAQAEAAVVKALLREERRMKHWTSNPEPQETLEQMSTEDKITSSYEDDLWEPPPQDWRELASEERLLLKLDILNMLPKEQQTDEVLDAIGEAIVETERRLCEPR
jgi:hypothetical protein